MEVLRVSLHQMKLRSFMRRVTVSLCPVATHQQLVCIGTASIPNQLLNIFYQFCKPLDGSRVQRIWILGFLWD